MPPRLLPICAIVVSGILLASCNLPSSPEVTPATATATLTARETRTPEIPTPAAETPVTPEQNSFNPNPELMAAPADIRIETIPAEANKLDPPADFRKRLILPIGGMEGLSSCETGFNAPIFQNAPTEYQALQINSWNENMFLTCGWAKGDTVRITLTRPDGSTEITSQIYEDDISVSYYPPMEYGMQLGEYSVTFESPSGKISQTFNIVWPTEPGIVDTGEKKFFIYGFQPNEKLYALAYQQSAYTLVLSTWQSLNADQRGELMLDDNFDDAYLAVVGETSGPVWSSWLVGAFVGDHMFYKQVDPCQGAPTSKLQPFSYAYVTAGLANNVRSSPSKTATLVGKIAPLTVIQILKNDPVCADGFLWWKIVPRDTREPQGWTAEGQGSDYWIQPLE